MEHFQALWIISLFTCRSAGDGKSRMCVEGTGSDSRLMSEYFTEVLLCPMNRHPLKWNQTLKSVFVSVTVSHLERCKASAAGGERLSGDASHVEDGFERKRCGCFKPMLAVLNRCLSVVEVKAGPTDPHPPDWALQADLRPTSHPAWPSHLFCVCRGLSCCRFNPPLCWTCKAKRALN